MEKKRSDGIARARAICATRKKIFHAEGRLANWQWGFPGPGSERKTSTTTIRQHIRCVSERRGITSRCSSSGGQTDASQATRDGTHQPTETIVRVDVKSNHEVAKARLRRMRGRDDTSPELFTNASATGAPERWCNRRQLAQCTENHFPIHVVRLQVEEMN